MQSLYVSRYLIGVKVFFFILSCTQPDKTIQDTGDSVSDELSFEDTLIEAIEQDMTQTGATAFSMTVLKDGAVSWSGGFGQGTKDGSSVSSQTLFRVASITKPMTAVLTLQQVQEECLTLESPVEMFLDNFVMAQQPELSSTVLVKDTMQMTGGFVDYQLQSGEDGDGMIEGFIPAYLENGYFLSEPGRMYNYSNPNFVVAGSLVEYCTDNYFRLEMEENLWTPLQMNRTTFETDTVIADGSYAVGVTTYWPQNVGEEISVDAQSYSASHLWPAMGAWSSAEDLAQFGLFLMQGDTDILSADLFSEMQQPQVDTEEGYESKAYGYGLYVKDGIEMGGAHYPVTMISHSGTIYGYTSHMYLIPELEVGVIVLLNREKAVPSNSVPIALGLAELVEPYEPDVSISDEVSEYTGEYYNAFNIGTMLLEETESGLGIEIPALDNANIEYDSNLEPVRPDNFYIHYPDGSFDLLSFIRDESGAVEYLRSRNYVGKKQQGQSYSPRSSSQETNIGNDFGAWESSIDIFKAGQK